MAKRQLVGRLGIQVLSVLAKNMIFEAIAEPPSPERHGGLVQVPKMGNHPAQAMQECVRHAT
jgi:hypothetical protein